MRERPIALFDSGVGGLQVMAAIHRLLPQENLVYLGDTARLPYGNRSGKVVQHYAWSCAQFLERFCPKVLIIACNTATAYALHELQAYFTFPVIGVIAPSVKAAMRHTQHRDIGLLATRGTVASKAYERILAHYAPEAHIHAVAAPLLVPLAEEGYDNQPPTLAIAQDYIRALYHKAGKHNPLDTIILGCTHYPLLLQSLQRACPSNCTLINSATATATEVAELLSQRRWQQVGLSPGQLQLFFTDWHDGHAQLAQRLLGKSSIPIHQIDLAAELFTQGKKPEQVKMPKRSDAMEIAAKTPEPYFALGRGV